MPGNIHDLSLPDGQIDSVQRLADCIDDKPLITVLVEGRPRILKTIHDNSDAVLQAYLPGPWGGQAIGEVIFGINNPSGRLPYTYPKYAGDINLNYWRPVSDVWDPLYEFGHGLSYSTFSYSNITVNGQLANEAKPLLDATSNKEMEVSLYVTNASPVSGKEAVLMFVQQPFRAVTPPAKLLKGFQKLSIPAGQTVDVKFAISADLFRYTGLDGIPHGTIDEGTVRVLIGDQQFEFEVVNNVLD